MSETIENKYSEAECLDIFVKRMNQKASMLDMNNTIFYNPTGEIVKNEFPSLTTTDDIVRMLAYVCSNSELRKIWNIKTKIINITGDNYRKINITIPTTDDSIIEKYPILFGNISDNLSDENNINLAIVTVIEDKIVATAISEIDEPDNRFIAMEELLDLCKSKINGKKTGNKKVKHAKSASACIVPLISDMQVKCPIKFLFSQNGNKIFTPLSLIKIMTAITAIDEIKDTKQTITVTASDIYSKVRNPLLANDVMTLEDALYLIPSNNFIARTLARCTGNKILENYPSYNYAIDFWNKHHLNIALPKSKFHNFSKFWSGSGLKIGHNLVNERDMIYVKGDNDDKGVVFERLQPNISRVSALISSGSQKLIDSKLPVVEVVSNFIRTLCLLCQYIRQNYTGKVIAITGSAGKSTTTSLVYRMLEPFGACANLNMCNAMGGICWNVASFDTFKKYWVVETSIGRGSIVSPDIAIITNLTAVHLTAGSGIENMAEAKSRIFSTMSKNSHAVINKDTECYEIFEQHALEKGLKIITTSVKDDEADIKIIPEKNAFYIKSKKKTYVFSKSYTPLHILYDMASAIGVALILNLDIDFALSKLRNFEYLEGRGRVDVIEAEKGNISIADESFNANPLSMRAALNAFNKNFKKNKVLFLGDMAELGDMSEKYHLEIVDIIRELSQIKKIVFVGKEMKIVYEKLKDSYKCQYFNDADELLNTIEKFITPGDNILFKSSHSIGLHKVADKVKTLKF